MEIVWGVYCLIRHVKINKYRILFLQAPFEKQCKKNDVCIAQLDVDLQFLWVSRSTPNSTFITLITSGCSISPLPLFRSETFLVAENSYFNMLVKLDNHGDDSYNTSLTLHYPPGLSFSMMELTEVFEISIICHVQLLLSTQYMFNAV